MSSAGVAGEVLDEERRGWAGSPRSAPRPPRRRAGSTSSGCVIEASETNSGAERGARLERFTHGDRQPRLSDPARACQRHQARVRRLEQVRHRDDVVLTPDQRGRHRRDRVRRGLMAAAGSGDDEGRRCRADIVNRSLSSTARSSRISRPSSRGLVNVR